MSRGLAYRLIVATVTAACSTSMEAGPFFMGLGDLPGGTVISLANGVSADGSVVVGGSNSSVGFQGFHWTQAGGLVALGGNGSQARGASADGAVIVGWNGVTAFRWTQASGIVSLGDLPGGLNVSEGYGVSGDGSVVVGRGHSASGSEAFRWTAATGMVGLGDLPGGTFESFAYGVSADGSVIVGSGRVPANNLRAYRWTSSDGMVDLGDLGISGSQALGVSADGSTVVGTASSQAFRWTQISGMVSLGDVIGSGGSPKAALAASADGSIIVGRRNVIGFGLRAFVWDATNGMRDLQDILVNQYGLGSSLTGWTLQLASGVSADGLTFVGQGTNPNGQSEAWIARIVPEPSTFALGGIGIFALAGFARSRS